MAGTIIWSLTTQERNSHLRREKKGKWESWSKWAKKGNGKRAQSSGRVGNLWVGKIWRARWNRPQGKMGKEGVIKLWENMNGKEAGSECLAGASFTFCQFKTYSSDPENAYLFYHSSLANYTHAHAYTRFVTRWKMTKNGRNFAGKKLKKKFYGKLNFQSRVGRINIVN